MSENLETPTYFYISPKLFGIYLLDIKNLKNLYKQELKIEDNNNFINFKKLELFLSDNIFKIEKLTGKFIKNISLIIEDNEISNINFGIKKKNYDTIISKKYLENTVIDGKDLFKENYKNEKIMHVIIKSFLINDKHYKIYEDDLIGDYLCLEINIISIPHDLCSEIEKIFQKFQIKISKYLDKKYINDFFDEENLELSNMAYKIQTGINLNEVNLVPKKSIKTGIFEKFFQLFS